MISNFLFSRYTTPVFSGYLWSDISFCTLVIGSILFILVLINTFNLSKKITNYELKK